MAIDFKPSGFQRLAPLTARVVLGVFAAFTIVCVATTLSPLVIDNTRVEHEGEGDIPLYWADIKRMRAGESYYEALSHELRPRGYPTKSVFNWRSPLPVWLVAKLPDPGGRVLLCIATAGVFVYGFRILEREGGVGAILLGMPLLFGSLAPVWMGDLYVVTELWGGVFIALSLCSYGVDRRLMGVTTGIAAQFARELSCVYTVIAMCLACRERRWKELAGWTLGMAVYAAYWYQHYVNVQPWIRPDDLAHHHGWVRFNALPFILATAHMNCLLLAFPQWVIGFYFPLAMLGLASWSTPTGTRIGLTMAGYVVFFGIVGQSFNQYWGAIHAPLLCFGFAMAPAALRDLWHAAQLGTAGRRATIPAA